MRRIALIFSVFFALGICSAEDIPSLAIFDFSDYKGKSTVQGKKLSILIFSSLASCDKIKLLERMEIEKILKERELTAGGITAKGSYSVLGTLLGANYILKGTIYKADGKTRFNAKLIECATGKISGISSAYKDDKNTDEMTEDFVNKASEYIKKQIAK